MSTKTEAGKGKIPLHQLIAETLDKRTSLEVADDILRTLQSHGFVISKPFPALATSKDTSKMKPLTPLQAAVLKCALANPTWGVDRITRALNQNRRMVAYRLRTLRARGLITTPPRKNRYA